MKRAVVALLLVAACGHGGPRLEPRTPTRAAGLKVTPVARFTIEASSVYGLTGWGHYIAWSAQETTTSEPNGVFVYDLSTGVRRRVAAAKTKKAEIDYVRGDDDTLVYTELARTPNDQDPGGLAVPWSEYAVDLKSGGGKRILSVRNDRPRDSVLPFPNIDYPWVVDATPPKTSGAGVDIYLYDLRSGRGRTILSSVKIGGGIGIEGDDLLYNARSGPNRYDLFRAPIGGTDRPRRVTRSGQVTGNTTGNEATVWHEPSGSEPQSLWWMAAGAAQPIRFAGKGYHPQPGSGFVAWVGADGSSLIATDPTRNGSDTILSSEAVSDFAAFGDRVVWATAHGGEITVHVAKVTAA